MNFSWLTVTLHHLDEVASFFKSFLRCAAFKVIVLNMEVQTEINKHFKSGVAYTLFLSSSLPGVNRVRLLPLTQSVSLHWPQSHCKNASPDNGQQQLQ